MYALYLTFYVFVSQNEACILRDETMGDKIVYILIKIKNLPFCRLKLLVKKYWKTHTSIIYSPITPQNLELIKY